MNAVLGSGRLLALFKKGELAYVAHQKKHNKLIKNCFSYRSSGLLRIGADIGRRSGPPVIAGIV